MLRWGIQRRTSVIPKTSNLGRLQENFDAVSFELTTDDMEQMKTLSCGFRGCDTKTKDFMHFFPLFD